MSIKVPNMKMIRVKRLNLNQWVLIILYFVMLICLRGMILGNLFPVIGMLSGALCIIIAFRRRYDKRSQIFIACCIFWAYCSIQGIIMNSNSRSYLIQIFFYWMFEAGAAFTIFQDKINERMVCRILIRILSILAVSYMASFALALFIGWNRLQIGQIDYNYFYKAPLFFPLTLAYGYGTVGGITIWRLLGIARESGIMQCLYSWAFFSVDRFFSETKRLKILLILGIIICFSTTGIVAFVAIIAVNQLTKSLKKLFSWQTLGIAVVVVAALFLLFSDSTYGLNFRLQTSFSDRQIAMAYGLSNLARHPFFGVGFFKESTILQADVNLIASAGNIGMVGIILFLLIYTVAFFISDDKRLFLTSNASFVITAIATQPLFISPLMYLFLFNDYSKKVMR